ncbi:hypothetical protein J3B02_003131 [Coemansia erecta]|uniref:SUN domain-containing protein n=1 Tax=Coemansia asiatica TaxID=1052880 RepID=A0A9W7XHD3_9FUNG|nr:hypothetical protein LPJ64_005326 [Coemansia asiatica]KAJ2853460.1 hypothetical protein J3B02_003131 [Coemansia erecta]KAJ2882953.1 hypothetical protein FB639_002281 [Coemansia asiatica]
MNMRFNHDTDDHRHGSGAAGFNAGERNSLHHGLGSNRYLYGRNEDPNISPLTNAYTKRADMDLNRPRWDLDDQHPPELGSKPNWLKKVSEQRDPLLVDRTRSRLGRANGYDNDTWNANINGNGHEINEHALGTERTHNAAGIGSTYGGTSRYGNMTTDLEFDSENRPGGRAAGSLYGSNAGGRARGTAAGSALEGGRYAASGAGSMRQSLYTGKGPGIARLSEYAYDDPYSKNGASGYEGTSANNFGKPTRAASYAIPYGDPHFTEAGEEDMVMDNNSPVQTRARARVRPQSSLGAYAAGLMHTTPRRLSFEHVSSGKANGQGTVKRTQPTPRTAQIKGPGPGAFPATAQRFSQRKKASGSFEDDALSPTISRTGMGPGAGTGTGTVTGTGIGIGAGIATDTGDLLASHRYFGAGKASSVHRGWGEYGASAAVASALGAHGASASVHSFSDSFISNSSDAADASYDKPTLVRRLFRNIFTGWPGSFPQQISFLLMTAYFVAKEVALWMARLVLYLLLGVLRGSVRSLVALIVVALAAALATQYAGPISFDVRSVVKSSLFGFGFGSGSGPGPRSSVPIAPLSTEDITKLGGAGSFVVERLQQVDQSISQLYTIIEALKAHHNDDAAEAREALQRLHAERVALVSNVRSDKKRIDSLENEHAAFKREMGKAVSKAAGANDLQALQKQVESLSKKAAGSGSGGIFGFGSKGLSASAVRKIVNDEIRVQRSKLRSLNQPEWLVSDGDSALANVANMIDSALERFAKDRLAKTDFALFSAGARIVPKLTSPTYEQPVRGLTRRLWHAFGFISSMPPSTILDPSTHIGECWPMQGSSGQIAVHLPSAVDVTEFALEHVSRSMAIDWRSAPRSIEVWGYVISDTKTQKDGNVVISEAAEQEQQSETNEEDFLADGASTASEPAVDPEPTTVNPPFAKSRSDAALGKLEMLAKYEYEPSDSKPLQIIPTFQDVQGRRGDGTIRARTIILKINSNWGHPDHTCIYRFRVHGLPPPSL